jgi:hypothetical protein
MSTADPKRIEVPEAQQGILFGGGCKACGLFLHSTMIIEDNID